MTNKTLRMVVSVFNKRKMLRYSKYCPLPGFTQLELPLKVTQSHWWDRRDRRICAIHVDRTPLLDDRWFASPSTDRATQSMAWTSDRPTAQRYGSTAPIRRSRV